MRALMWKGAQRLPRRPERVLTQCLEGGTNAPESVVIQASGCDPSISGKQSRDLDVIF